MKFRQRKSPGWPSKYSFLKDYLETQGFTVYPTEIAIITYNCPVPRHPWVDVGAFKGGFYYAFEYKSAGDYLPRAKEQILNYRLSFDFVVVVAEIPRRDVSVNPKRGRHAREIVKLGAGLWTVNKDVFNELAPPQKQNPIPENRQWMNDKFHRYVWKDLPFDPLDPRQKRLEEFILPIKCAGSKKEKGAPDY